MEIQRKKLLEDALKSSNYSYWRGITIAIFTIACYFLLNNWLFLIGTVVSLFSCYVEIKLSKRILNDLGRKKEI